MPMKRRNARGGGLCVGLPSSLILTLLLGFACTTPREDVTCGDGQAVCPLGWACNVESGLCYASPPEIIVDQPIDGSRQTGKSIDLIGSVSDNTSVSEVSYRVGNVGGWQKLGTDSAGRFSATVALPASNGGTVDLNVRALDSSGLEAIRTVAIPLDNTPPTLVRVRRTNTPMPPTSTKDVVTAQIVFEFSEDVTPEPDWISATPEFVQNAISGKTVLEIPLQGTHATQYVATVRAGGIKDTFGLPLEKDLQLTFTTPALGPSHDAVVTFSSLPIKSFHAVSDPIGAVTLVALADAGGAGQLQQKDFDVSSGTPQHRRTVALRPTDDFYSAVAGTTFRRNVGGAGSRTTGLVRGNFADPGTGVIQWTGPSGQNLEASHPGLIPYADACRTDELGTHAVIQRLPEGTFFERPGNEGARIPLEITPHLVLARSASEYELLNWAGGNLLRQTHQLICGDTAKELFNPSVSLAGDLSAQPNISAALAAEDDVALYVYNDLSGTRRELCVYCSYGRDRAQCPQQVSEPAAWKDLLVASRNSGSKILGASRKSDRSVELFERDLEKDCKAPWVSIGLVSSDKPILAFQPLMFGAKPGVLAQFPTELRVLLPRTP